MIEKLLTLAKAFLGTNQNSTPGKFDLEDLWYTVKLALVVFVGTGAVAALGVLNKYDFGFADAAVSAGVAWLVAAIEAWQADNS
ncbi:hypothetical protein [Planctomyces sp. SH-PL14]|uniref:hypothetical protein n=1 Tax=Planctomyces sp. SH-PL14 TaxID=1632864 RepID=UPI00078C5C4A|nr:hypothetical protein [Planctomyces sp. SH-PL14]AMV20431.1 hypothetical protein VT03_21210 [Planctomyces sp. SH-PL14]